MVYNQSYNVLNSFSQPALEGWPATPFPMLAKGTGRSGVALVVGGVGLLKRSPCVLALPLVKPTLGLMYWNLGVGACFRAG